MTAIASRNLLYFVTGLIVFVRAYQLIRLDWSRPLKHGPGFFMTFEVAPGFYSGAGSRWLGRYRGVLLGEYMMELIALATLVAFGLWQWLPAWAGGMALLYVASLGLFALAARRALGDSPAQPAVAVSLDDHRHSGPGRELGGAEKRHGQVPAASANGGLLPSGFARRGGTRR